MAVISLNSHRKLPASGKHGDAYIVRHDDGTFRAHIVTDDGTLVQADKLVAVKSAPAGEPGPRGPEGKAPTEAELERLIRRVLSTMLIHQGPAGKDGKTPVKGVDYFDGEKGAPGDVLCIGDREMRVAVERLRKQKANFIARVLDRMKQNGKDSSGAGRLAYAHFKALLAEINKGEG